ncbi:flagellar hook-basal body complex protein [Arcobacter sp. FWKO B]|uniref:flagellar hook-basal body complex protein n=1 Tax=Arcobacter sp. FWKO B TaxID=2593672 RepID=UPI0018A3A892|nr:flagellar hook-basal body complex protein [Arcobacter sp. FWKO B]QOG12018.1 flagellar hook-basal body complex protein [Arcobacter sp. FWKO B]
MIGALWTGISGLSSHQKALDNEATNIANVNTVGYKASRISFADQMYQDKIGKGSKVLDAEKLYVQGNLKVTGVSFDMALSGSGFFTVSDTRSSGSSETYYTRAGNFRMGEDGTLQDAAGNKVQGWAMRDVDSDTDVKSTNPNISYFTNDYTKLAASKIIRHNNKIETITAKMTDYTQTAVADSATIFSGAGLKSKSAKITDIEALISDYNAKLTAYQTNPAATSSPSTAQVSYVKFQLDGTASADGDQMYVYINGTKYSQSWEGSQEATLKKLSDQISAIPGFKAEIFAQQNTVTAATAGDTVININGTTLTVPFNGTQIATAADIKSAIEGNVALNKLVNVQVPSTPDGTLIITSKTPGTDITYSISGTGAKVETNDQVIYDGRMKIESLIPGKIFTLGEVAEASGSTTSVGSKISEYETAAIIGTGFGAVKSAQEALLMAVSGVQRDVYTSTDIGLGGSEDGTIGKTANYTYQISIFDPETNANINVPTTPLSITGASTINEIVNAINTPGATGNSLTDYMVAKNVNGTLVIEAKPEFAGYKINGTLAQLTGTAEVQRVELSGPATADGTITFMGQNFSVDDTQSAAVVANNIASNFDIEAWNTANPTKEIASISSDGADVVITYAKTEGNVDLAVVTSATAGITVDDISADVEGGSLTTATTKEKNSSSSGFSGAGAEFIQMINTVDQTASQSSLQLRLDILNISDSAFGEFNVDSSGLITMKQDGAEYAIGQVAIALFNNERGLIPIGDNLVTKSSESGEPVFNINNDKTAKIEARTLELSTADLSESLVNLMVFQRAFEANAKSITTSDEILNTLINLKR